MFFEEKLESIQYDAYLAITGAMRGSSKGKIYEELGLQPLQLQCWFRELKTFYKIFKSKSSSYLFKLISEKIHAYVIRNVDNSPLLTLDTTSSKTLSSF